MSLAFSVGQEPDPVSASPSPNSFLLCSGKFHQCTRHFTSQRGFPLAAATWFGKLGTDSGHHSFFNLFLHMWHGTHKQLASLMIVSSSLRLKSLRNTELRDFSHYWRSQILEIWSSKENGKINHILTSFTCSLQKKFIKDLQYIFLNLKRVKKE